MSLYQPTLVEILERKTSENIRINLILEKKYKAKSSQILENIRGFPF